jgi:signal transduction histidine kinase/CheY-like chemotaxis protein
MLMMLAMGLLVNQLVQKRSIQESVRQRVDSVTALSFYSERELLRLQRELAVQLAQPQALEREQLQMRYDIFLSGIAWLRNSPSMAAMSGRPQYTELPPKLDALIKFGDTALGRKQLDPRELQELLLQLDAMQLNLMALSSAATSVESRQFESVAERMLGQSDLILGLAVLQILLLLLACAALLLRQRRQRAEQRAMELLNAELQQERHKADAANQAKSQFLANMSHELRTPFNGILGMLRILQSTGLTAQQQDCAAMMGRATNSLLALINDILDFSKVEAGKMQVSNQPFYLDRLLRDVSDILSAATNSENVDVLFDVDPGLEPALWGDSMKLQQVLINLGSNAIKFTSKGSVVIAARRRTAADGRPDTGMVVEFLVSDTGIGIAREHQLHIFSGFSQAEATTTRKYGGSGLGLAISKRLVELMGGRLALQSEAGQGSTFSFAIDLPMVTDALQESLPPPAMELQAIRRVLVVDDSEVSRGIVARLTRSWNWHTDVAESGQQALVLFQDAIAAGQQPWQVIVVDWHMPGMDGWEFVRRLRQLALPEGSTAPSLVMISGTSRDRLAQHPAKDQALINALLVRPFTSAQLREVALRPLGTQTFLRQGARTQAPHGRLAGMRILVVEDNLLNQKVAEELLKLEGAHITIAANGQLAVDAALSDSASFDVVLMDLQMPVMDGYEATRIIRQTHNQQQLPIIAMTANAMASDRAACLAAGMNEHIGKPFDMGKLVSLLIRTVAAHAHQEQRHEPEPEAPAAPAATMAPASAAPVVPGLELHTALQRLAGECGLYVRAAREFEASLSSLLPELRLLHRSAEQTALQRKLHTLKGNAATLGASALAQQAAALEQRLKADPAIDLGAALEAMAPVLATTRGSLRQAIALLGEAVAPVAQAPAATAADRLAGLALLQELCALLHANDMDALLRFGQGRGLLASCFGPWCEQLDVALQDLQLEQALVLCRAKLAEASAADTLRPIAGALP